MFFRVTGRPCVTSVVTTAISTPVMFVTQVPTAGDIFAGRLAAFANHMTDMTSVPRGGDLMIRYPDGSLRNLTKEAGFGMEGRQGANAIAVREPTVHWDGKKAVFSMLVGAPTRQYEGINVRWQLYEVTNLAQGQVAVITKVAGQPTAYNNVSPLYASDDRILFASDRPRTGEAHLYPQLDEYESTPTLVGLYSLTPASGELRLLNHTPSGAFSPTIDSYGRVIFTRWDHLQRDQQAERHRQRGRLGDETQRRRPQRHARVTHRGDGGHGSRTHAINDMSSIIPIIANQHDLVQDDHQAAHSSAYCVQGLSIG